MSSWTFESTDIAADFNNHVREQLPWYDMVTDAVCYITRNYLTQNNILVDVGASTGNTIHNLMDLLEERKAQAVAMEKSGAMHAVMCERFAGNSRVHVHLADATGGKFPEAQVFVVFLTMMFIPVDQRESVLNELRAACKRGGAIIIVDKVLDHGGYFATVLKRLGMHWKIRQGAKLEEVTSKEMSLAGVQIPFDPKLIPDGKEFFRMGEFVGWVIEA